MKLTLIIVVALAVSLSACATKQYPIATELSSVEKSELTCRELKIESAKVDEISAKIADTATLDWKSVAGFLGDYGIGNTLAKNEAEKALAQRKLGINAAEVAKGC